MNPVIDPAVLVVLDDVYNIPGDEIPNVVNLVLQSMTSVFTVYWWGEATDTDAMVSIHRTEAGARLAMAAAADRGLKETLELDGPGFSLVEHNDSEWCLGTRLAMVGADGMDVEGWSITEHEVVE